MADSRRREWLFAALEKVGFERSRQVAVDEVLEGSGVEALGDVVLGVVAAVVVGLGVVATGVVTLVVDDEGLGVEVAVVAGVVSVH